MGSSADPLTDPHILVDASIDSKRVQGLDQLGDNSRLLWIDRKQPPKARAHGHTRSPRNPAANRIF
eukprot:COSAG03_NODE_2380_length_2824_cov_24.791927_2_plen_66_part_00